MNKNLLKILVCIVLTMALVVGCAKNNEPVEPPENSVPVTSQEPAEENDEQPNAQAEKAYKAFLKGKISVTTSEKFREDDGEYNYDGLLYGTYSYEELKAAIAEFEGHGSTTKYAFADFGQDGVNELVIRFDNVDPSFLNWVGIIRYNGEGLDLNYYYEDGYRTFSELYSSGYLQVGGSFGAGASGSRLFEFDKNGVGTEIFTVNSYYGTFVESAAYDLRPDGTGLTGNYDDIAGMSAIEVSEYVAGGAVKLFVSGWSEDTAVREREEALIGELVEMGAEIVSEEDMKALCSLSPYKAPEVTWNEWNSGENADANEESDVKARVDAMLPIMDSIICTSGVDEDYEPQNPEYFWSVLYLMGVNWGQTHPLVTEQDGRMVVGRQTMQEFASAAFIGYDDLPEIPEELTQAITYDEALDSYMLMLSDRGDSETRIDDWTVADDGTVTAYVGLYSGDGTKIAMYVVTLVANEYASGISDPIYFYTVAGVYNTWREGYATTPMSADLNDDGTYENVDLVYDSDECIQTVVFAIDGVQVEHVFELPLWNASCHIGDADITDGRKEVYICGDTGSDDYETYIFAVSDGKLIYSEIFGTVLSADGRGQITVNTVVHVLGTYGADTKYELASDLTPHQTAPFEIDSYNWEYRALKVQRDGLLGESLASGETVELAKGTELLLRETDAKTYVILEQRDGSRVKLGLTENNDLWGWCIDNVPEGDLFGELMYAD